jgi:hypothetical protein
MSRTANAPDNSAIRELRDELKNLNVAMQGSGRATERYTVILLFVAFAQAIIAIVQLGVSLDTGSMLPLWVKQMMWAAILLGALVVLWKNIVAPIFESRGLWEK